jgi:hypothetical protein
LAHVGFFNDYPDDFNMNEMKWMIETKTFHRPSSSL